MRHMIDIRAFTNSSFKLILVVALALTAQACTSGSSKTQEEEMQAISIQDIPFETITGDTTGLADFDGKVVLIVNVASECGYTKQYTGLEELYRKYKDRGFVILGFPANNFGGQEPGSNEAILEFCTTKFDVTFPMMAKVSVKGKVKHPLYVELTENSSIPGEIQWNFAKFVLDRQGNLVERFGSRTKPDSRKLVELIEKLLDQ